ncbi:MAG TPA: efflux RND transporter periplasmic adaptor subunit [Polyangiales bacterium]|jgi:RND family efflux transporter MFP subunit
MTSTLSADLAALKIDRAKTVSGGPPKAPLGWLLFTIVAIFAYAKGRPYLEAEFFKTEVDVTEIALVSPAQSTIELTSSGYVVPQVRSEVAAKVPGRVAKSLVREGDHVKAGQVLLELEHSDQLAAIQSSKLRAAASRARVSTAKANLAEIRRQADREAQLVKQGASPAARADDLAARAASLDEQVKASEAEVAALDAEVEALKVTLGYMTLVAPIDGTVLNKPPEVGDLLGNVLGLGTTNAGTIQIADFRSLMVETDVPEGRLHLVRIGSPCEIILDAYPQKRYRGEAVEVMPKVNRAKATVGVKVKFVDETDGVLPDMAARVSFLAKPVELTQLREKPKLIVPAAAVAERGGDHIVFVLDGETVHMRSVSLGAQFGDGFEMTAGPEAGTKVIKSPPETMLDGQKVKERTSS